MNGAMPQKGQQVEWKREFAMLISVILRKQELRTAACSPRHQANGGSSANR